MMVTFMVETQTGLGHRDEQCNRNTDIPIPIAPFPRPSDRMESVCLQGRTEMRMDDFLRRWLVRRKKGFFTPRSVLLHWLECPGH